MVIQLYEQLYRDYIQLPALSVNWSEDDLLLGCQYVTWNSIVTQWTIESPIVIWSAYTTHMADVYYD